MTAERAEWFDSMQSRRNLDAVNDAERYRDLAERVLGRSAGGTEVALTLDALPPEADGRIRLPDGSRVIGSVVRRPMGELLSIAVHVASPLDAKSFSDAVRAIYEAEGYRPAPLHPGMSGFRPSVTGAFGGSVLCRGEDGPWMSAGARATASGSEGSIVWNGPAAGAGPCAQRPQGGMGFPDVLPPLEAPEGVELLLGGGSGGGGSSWTSNATAYTSLNARDLVAAFAPQLEAAGASGLGSGGDEVVGWGQWRLAKEPWQASLVAFGRDERKDLQLRIERADHRKREDLMRRGASWRTFGF